MIFKCKMCGGTIEFEQGATVGVCDSCGTKQTLPRLDDDRRANLYDRANHFRRNNEFDKAAAIYEQILTEDTTDAEAYWSLVLCQYGIEYVEDPATRKRVPTVNRAQFTSIFDDDNYKSAIQYADGYQRELYEKEAKTINDIQKGILAISQKEDSFDVFICYKETDNNGRRTPDSVLANDLYYQLKQEGFKVFFARITLEDKLGTAYEPYIFAALNSAKVMVVLGTKAEYFNAVWVKNEWSRYLALVKKSSGKKILIPAYKDMDPYDLPEEFSHLQAQDMSKIGFMQDLIRGIKKIINVGDTKAGNSPKAIGETNVDALLERAKISLEDGEFGNAADFCERVLDVDAKNSTAYLYKLMADLKVRKYEELKDLPESFIENSNLAKIQRYDNKLHKELIRICSDISQRFLEKSMEEWYLKAKELLDLSDTSAELEKALSFLESAPLKNYKDIENLIVQCKDRIEKAKLQETEAEKQANYIKAVTYFNKDNKGDLQQAIVIFHNLNGYKDSEERLLKAKEKIKAINAEEKKKAEEEAEKKRIADERKKKKKTIIAIIYAAATLVTIAVSIICGAITNADKEARGYCVLQKNGSSYSVVGLEDNAPSEIVIPREYKGLPVTEISSYAFYTSDDLRSVTIPDSVTTIGNFSFGSKLKSAVFINPIGWKAGPNMINSADLSNKSDAAYYLIKYRYEWTRS